MRAARLSSIAFITMTALIAGACGSSAKPAAAPPPRLRLSPAAGATADAAKPALYPQGSTTYVLDGTLADLGARAAVRKLVSHDVTAADVTHLATVFGMHGTPTRTGTAFEVRDGDALLTVETGAGTAYVSYSSAGNAGGGSSPGAGGSGAATSPATGAPDAPADTPVPVDPAPPVPAPDVTIEKPGTLIPTPPTPTPPIPMPTIPPAVDVPNADDAAGIAQSLLTDLGVLGDQQWSHAVTDAEGTSVSCAPDGPCDPPPPSSITARTVTYSLVVDGHDIPDVGWSVTIGSHRKVEWVSGVWGRPDAGTDYALRSTQKVFDDLRAGRAQYVGPQPMLARGAAEIAPNVAPDGVPDSTPVTAAPIVVHVTGVALGAARWDGTDNGAPVTYLVPTYRFHATIAGGSPYDIELLALDPASFSVVSPPVTAVPHTGPPESGGPKTGIVPQPAIDLPGTVPPPIPTPAPTYTPTPNAIR